MKKSIKLNISTDDLVKLIKSKSDFNRSKTAKGAFF